MFFNTIASFAEFESAQIGERTWNAMSSKVGQIHLGGKAPIGYRLVRGRLKINPKFASIVETIFTRFLAVKNYSKVAEYLNKKGLRTSCNVFWSHKKIYRVLTNPVYTGALAWGKRRRRMWRNNSYDRWILKNNTHEPIVSQKMFERVQNIILVGRTGVRVSKEMARKP
jgi:DNA invertase Pin-like site-specific DNA recombinase